MKTEPPLYYRPQRKRSIALLVAATTEFMGGLAAALGCTLDRAKEIWTAHSHDMTFIEKVDELMKGRHGGVQLGDQLRKDGKA